MIIGGDCPKETALCCCCKVINSWVLYSIREQESLWDERGKGYYGEYLVFRELLYGVSGCGKILMNLQIPGYYTNNDTELDLIFLHETGIYVFEVKHYKGTIYGRATDEQWTQYFRTSPNQRFYNPMRQNNGHIKALSELLGDSRIYSIVVFTNPEVDLRIKNDDPSVVVCRLSELSRVFNGMVSQRPNIHTAGELNRLFMDLLPYAPVMQQPVVLDGKEIPFYKYFDAIKQDADDRVEAIHQQSKAAGRKHLGICAAVAAVIAAAAIAFSFVRIGTYKQQVADADSARLQAEAETEAMRKNFEHVDNLKAMEQSVPADFLTVSDVQIINSKEVDNAIEISAKITVKSDIYSAKFSESTMIIVQITDGTVKEYGFFDGINKYVLKDNAYHNYTILLGQSVDKLILADVSKDEISYIKIAHISLCDYPYGRIIRSDLELEIYSK